jgi:hypothetical protein
VVPTVAALVLVAVAVSTGLWLHAIDRAVGDTWHSVGTEAPDRIDVNASVQRVDAVAREVILRVLVVPHGRLGEDDGLAPTGDLQLLNSSTLLGDQTFAAHERISSTDLRIALTGGPVTDYPYDRYEARIQFAAIQDGQQVPVLLTLDKVDSMFSLSISGVDAAGGLDVRLARSTSTVLFATFMMITMWAVAIAVLLGAWYLVRRRKGLIWPAFGFMAATLFALAGFRNVAPGLPPIGSTLDYSAFLWAELIIASSVVVSVVVGAVTESRSPA